MSALLRAIRNGVRRRNAFVADAPEPEHWGEPAPHYWSDPMADETTAQRRARYARIEGAARQARMFLLPVRTTEAREDWFLSVSITAVLTELNSIIETTRERQQEGRE